VQRLASLAVPTALCLSITAFLAVIPASPAAAETPFFLARGKQRCEALQAWYAEFLSISTPGVEKMRMGPELRALIARAFRDDIFQRHFGKTFGELSDSDKKKVQSELEDCFSDNSFVTYFVTSPFEHREKWQQTSAHKEWMVAIEAVRSAPPPPPPAPSALPPEPGERTLFILLGPGKKILSTPTYRVYLLGCDLEVVLRDPATPLGDNLRQLALKELIPTLDREPLCQAKQYRWDSINFYFESAVFAIYALDGFQHGSEDRGIRRHEGPEKPGSGYELPVLNLYFTGQAEGPYKVKATYIDQLAFDYDSFYEGDPNLNSLDRILAYVADPDSMSPFVAELASRRAAIREEQIRKAEARRREEQEALLRSQRREAAQVLSFLDGVPNPPPAYDFARFTNARLLADVYGGNFEPLTGGHSPEELVSHAFAAATAFGAMVGNSNWRAEQEKMAAHLEQMEDFAKRRTPLKLALKAYHEAFAQTCRRSSSRSPWVAVTFQRSLVKRDQSGAVLSKVDLGSKTIEVRKAYAAAFSDAYEFADDPGFFARAAIPGGLSKLNESLQKDFTQLLQSEGCDAPAVRLVEVNLFLAYQWLMPARQLR
jgi:hypothetical protein